MKKTILFFTALLWISCNKYKNIHQSLEGGIDIVSTEVSQSMKSFQSRTGLFKEDNNDIPFDSEFDSEVIQKLIIKRIRKEKKEDDINKLLLFSLSESFKQDSCFHSKLHVDYNKNIFEYHYYLGLDQNPEDKEVKLIHEHKKYCSKKNNPQIAIDKLSMLEKHLLKIFNSTKNKKKGQKKKVYTYKMLARDIGGIYMYLAEKVIDKSLQNEYKEKAKKFYDSVELKLKDQKFGKKKGEKIEKSLLLLEHEMLNNRKEEKIRRIKKDYEFLNEIGGELKDGIKKASDKKSYQQEYIHYNTQYQKKYNHDYYDGYRSIGKSLIFYALKLQKIQNDRIAASLGINKSYKELLEEAIEGLKTTEKRQKTRIQINKMMKNIFIQDITLDLLEKNFTRIGNYFAESFEKFDHCFVDIKENNINIKEEIGEEYIEIEKLKKKLFTTIKLYDEEAYYPYKKILKEIEKSPIKLIEEKYNNKRVNKKKEENDLNDFCKTFVPNFLSSFLEEEKKLNEKKKKIKQKQKEQKQKEILYKFKNNNFDEIIKIIKEFEKI